MTHFGLHEAKLLWFAMIAATATSNASDASGRAPSTEGNRADARACSIIQPTHAAPPDPMPSQCGDRHIIDVLWVYTPDALEFVGEEDWINLLCSQNITDTNESFANSNLPFSVRQVGLHATDYDESGDHLALIQGLNDGVMDEVHAVRDTLAADIVVLITVDGFCGVAYAAPNNPALGFQRVSASCLVSSAFRHELGHNLGSKHYATDLGGYLTYSSGHILSLPGNNNAGTIMGGNALQQFSNPRLSISGTPTGIAVEDPLAADNWLAIMQTGPMVAKFRCSRDCNNNGIPDSTEIAQGNAADCDQNGVPDECQMDLNANGLIDACETLPVTIHVPNDYPSIQLAMAYAESGVHEIVVAPGSYSGQIDFLGKNVTLRSSHGPAQTTLTANGNGRVVTFRTHETRDATLDGFTITSGSAYEGGALLIEYASPTISNCIITGNHAEYAGGALRATDGSPSIQQCQFILNSAGWGGAISLWQGSPEFIASSFINNTATQAGGAVSSWTSNATFTNCLFQHNTSLSPGGAMLIVDGSGAYEPTLSGNTFCENTPDHLSSSAWIDLGGNLFGTTCVCPADLNMDGDINFFDVSAFLTAFNAMDPVADFNNDGMFNFFDVSAFLVAYNAGCP
tara:strand:- start:712 stop:2592 length:1881 start_codon:yes stop_codon:yes gene_type:complete